MTLKIEAKVDGVQDLSKQLFLLEKGPRRKVLRRSLNKAADIPLKAAKALVVKGATGQLRKSLGKKIKASGSTATGYGVIGPRKGYKVQVGVTKEDKTVTRKIFKAKRGPGGRFAGFEQTGTETKVVPAGTPIYHDPVRIAHLVEFGHGGPHAAPAHPFLRPAWDQNKEAVEKKMGEELFAGILEELRK